MDQLAERIAAARLSGSELEGTIGVLSLEQGYAIQAQVVERLGRPVGWKAGATNAGGQRVLGVDGPIFGHVLETSLRQSGERADLAGDRAGEAEPEIVLRLGSGGAVVSAYLGIEVNRPSRSDAFVLGPGFIVADNAAHCALVIGPEISLDALQEPESVTVTFGHASGPTEIGNAAAVLGNPLRALEALAAARPLASGDWIATGAITRSCPLGPDDEIVADFGAWGRVSVRW